MEVRCWFVLLAALMPSTLSCTVNNVQYTLLIKNVKPCMKDSLIKFQNFSATLDSNCVVRPRGCVIIEKQLTTAQMNWKIQKGILPLAGSTDLCKGMKDSAEAEPILSALSLPTDCPMPKGKRCPKNGVNISKYKDKLPLAAGPMTVTLNVNHGKAGKSCVQVVAEVKQKAKGFMGR